MLVSGCCEVVAWPQVRQTCKVGQCGQLTKIFSSFDRLARALVEFCPPEGGGLRTTTTTLMMIMMILGILIIYMYTTLKVEGKRYAVV